MSELETQPIGHLFDVRVEGGAPVLSPKRSMHPAMILDHGLQNTAIGRSSISQIDAARPAIRYRGQDLNDLVSNHSALDVARLLIMGATDMQGCTSFLEQFQSALRATIDEYPPFLNSPLASDPIDHMIAALLWARERSDLQSGAAADKLSIGASVMAIACLSVASFEAARRAPSGALSIKKLRSAKTLATVLLGGSCGSTDAYAEEILEKFLVLHAEHGMNCSTATVCAVASARADPYSAMISGICAFRGPLHGGASEMVGKMIDELRASCTSPEIFVGKCVETRRRLMGFGHRIYSITDPRAAFMREMIGAGTDGFAPIAPFAHIANDLARTVEAHDYFVARGIFPNPDLYNGLLLRRAGFPSNMNTALLCCSRMSGWLAHYFESIEHRIPIIRPQDLGEAHHG